MQLCIKEAKFTIQATNPAEFQVVPKCTVVVQTRIRNLQLEPRHHFHGLVNMWERTLQDLIRGLRANKHDEAKFINQAIDEIRTEARSKDMGVKAAAILKMTFVSSIV